MYDALQPSIKHNLDVSTWEFIGDQWIPRTNGQ